MENRRRQFKLSFVLAMVILFALCGCKTVNKLRTAQDSFNKAAQLDNQNAHLSGINNISMETLSAAPVGLQNESNLLYFETLQTLKTINEEDQNELKKHKLYGNYIILKGLTNWKLGNSTEAYNVLRNAKENEKYFTNRDRMILKILPSLVALGDAKPIYHKGTQSFDKECVSLNRIMPILSDKNLKDLEYVLSNPESPIPLKIYAAECKLLIYYYRMEVYESALESEIKNCASSKYAQTNQTDKKSYEHDKIRLGQLIKDIPNSGHIIQYWNNLK